MDQDGPVTMHRLQAMWAGLDGVRRGVLIGGLAALVAVAVILGRFATEPADALLFSGLEAGAAGEVMAALDGQGVSYSVQGSAIYVPEDERDALRLMLAGEGLPTGGAAGYELLDGLSGFGTTSQMFDAALVRAREGELARTITASPMVSAARVHLGIGGDRPFAHATAPTASVTLRTRGGPIAADHAQALRFLVASAVPGLDAAGVSIIDAETGQLVGGEESVAGAAAGARRAEEIRANIVRLLTARVGPGNAVVEVAVDLFSAREVVVERRIDPDSRVVVATEREDRSDRSSEGPGADGVTVASNLPTGDAGAAPDEGASLAEATEAREAVTYDMSELQRETERAAGALRRVSVAVLVATPVETAADGTVTARPRGPEELAAIEALARSAMGFDSARGDQVTVREMVFAEASVDLAEGAGTATAPRLDPVRAGAIAALGLVAIGVMAFVIRPLLLADPTRAPAAIGAPEAMAGLPTGEPAASAHGASPDAAAGARALPAPETAAGGAQPSAPPATDRRRRGGSGGPAATADRRARGRDCGDPARLDGTGRGDDVMRPVTLEDFAAPPAAAAPQDAPAAEAPPVDPLDSYEQGYTAGWDDALSHQDGETARLGADLAATLADLDHGYAAARADVMAALRPVLSEIVTALLPPMAEAAVGPTLLAELEALVDGDRAARPEIRIAPGRKPAIEALLAARPDAAAARGGRGSAAGGRSDPPERARGDARDRLAGRGGAHRRRDRGCPRRGRGSNGPAPWLIPRMVPSAPSRSRCASRSGPRGQPSPSYRASGPRTSWHWTAGSTTRSN